MKYLEEGGAALDDISMVNSTVTFSVDIVSYMKANIQAINGRLCVWWPYTRTIV